MIRYPIGVSSFRELITGNYSFVDKTLFLKDFIEEGSKVILITRPRRFGKTLTLSMCDDFFNIENNEKSNIFEELNISKHEETCKNYQNKYPTIFISLKEFKDTSFEKAIETIRLLLSELYTNYIYLLDGDLLHPHEKNKFNRIINEEANEAEMKGAIKYLSLLLQKKYKQLPIILIDEYDTPIQTAYLKNYYQDMIEFMRGFLGSSLKDAPYHKALLTGISRISQESLFSGLNNFDAFTMLDEKYGNYFGFTEDEVTRLLNKAKVDTKLEDIKSWYNGYNIGGHIIYNAWSIINCLSKNGKLQNYWVNTSSNDLVYSSIDEADEKFEVDFEGLLNGQVAEVKLENNLVFTEIKEREDAIWSLLVHAGYLNVIEYNAPDKIAKVTVPNMEVMEVYQNAFRRRFLLNVGQVRYHALYKSLIEANFEKFVETLAFYLNSSASYFDFHKNTPEKVFHSFMLGILVALINKYNIVSNKESGKGRLDIAIIPKDNSSCGICLEFKVSDTKENMKLKAVEALQQIKDKNYIQMFQEHGVREVHGLGLAFFGKEVEMIHEKL